MRWLVSLILWLFTEDDDSLCRRCEKNEAVHSACPALMYVADDSSCNCCSECRQECQERVTRIVERMKQLD